MTKKEQKQIQPTLNPALLNVIQPLGIEVKRNNIIIGENNGKIYIVVKYPQNVDYGWLSKITNISGTICSISWLPIDSGEFIESLSRSIIMYRGQAESSKDPLIQQRAERAAIDGEKIMQQIDQQGETVGLLTVCIMPISPNDETLQKISRKTESMASLVKCKLRLIANLQQEGFKQLSPFYSGSQSVKQIGQRILPLSCFIGGFPFASHGHNDGSGYYFGRDNAGGLVILDTWKRGNDRTNSNWTIMGVAGTGKSTAVKHIAISEFMMGTKIIFIDPEREYKYLCNSLGGDWINAAGGSSGRINPLQIIPSPIDDEEETGEKLYTTGMGDMALHLKNLEIFFSLYLSSLTDLQKAHLKECLIELYNSFNIFWNTDITKLNNSDFPIFSDLYNLVCVKAKDSESYKELSYLLKDIATGSDSFLWNGHTTINTNTNCICLDTLDLQNTSDSIKRTQYFNILGWAWQQMSKDRNEKVLLICDEAYLMIDPNVPQSLVFLRNVEKRARKYEAAIGIISHSVVDFLDPQIKMYGQALLDIPCFKLLFGTDGQNLKETKELYNLTDAETDFLASKRRKCALSIIGARRLQVNFELPKYKLDLMGTAGGR